MKCPLLSACNVQVDVEIERKLVDCLEGECAWWLEDIRMCAMRALALETRYAQFRLQDISKVVHCDVQARL